MGWHDTGRSENQPNEPEISPNRDLEDPRADDSDSDMEEWDSGANYMPLSQNTNDGEPLYEQNNDSEEENFNFEEFQMVTPSDTNGSHDESLPISTVQPFIMSTLVDEVWSKPGPKEVDIEMGDKKVDLVKQVMSTIQLPSDTFPDWARNIPEEEWKNYLLQKLLNVKHASNK
ncbi:male-enhanced antigen 1 isoform X2 [Euwallacea fornicatus]|uniref:male-enhanced antigen 1 isoform X2 n=1 Tax=Euwallacea fornicatus TaxID=995702 RepID=UPI00338FFDED